MRNPFKKLTETDKRVAAIRADLQAARNQLAAIDAEEAEALADSMRFATWSTKRAVAASEVDRLERLATVTESAATETAKAEADAAARRETAAARKEGEELGKLLHTDGVRIFSEAINLAKRCALHSLKVAALNARLPEGEPPIPAADILARDHGAEPRQDRRSREVDLWVAATTGAIIGDQDAVASEDGVHGQVHVMGGTVRWKCIKRRFRETEFHPSTIADWPGALFSLIRLPRLDAPGLLFDGAVMTPEAVAALDVAATVAPRSKPPRSTQIELIPIDPTWPPPVTTEADDAAA